MVSSLSAQGGIISSHMSQKETCSSNRVEAACSYTPNPELRATFSKLDLSYFEEMSALVQKGTLEEVKEALPKLKLLHARPLELALESRRWDIAAVLFDAGLPVSDYAAFRLADSGAGVELKERIFDHPSTPVSSATFFKLVGSIHYTNKLHPLAKRLLQRGVKLKPVIEDFRWWKSSELIQLLLEHKCPIPAGVIGYIRSAKGVLLLLEAGVALTEQDVKRMDGHMEGSEEVLIELYGAILERGFSLGPGVMESAVWHYRDKLVDFLLKQGVQPDGRSYGLAVSRWDKMLHRRFLAMGVEPSHEILEVSRRNDFVQVDVELLKCLAEKPSAAALLSFIQWYGCHRSNKKQLKEEALRIIEEWLDLDLEVTQEHVGAFCWDLSRETLPLLRKLCSRAQPGLGRGFWSLSQEEDKELAVEATKILLQSGSQAEGTHLWYAALNGNLGMVQLFIKAGAPGSDLSTGRIQECSPEIRKVLMEHYRPPIHIGDLVMHTKEEEQEAIIQEILLRLPDDLRALKPVKELTALCRMLAGHDPLGIEWLGEDGFFFEWPDTLTWVTRVLRVYRQHYMGLEEFASLELPGLPIAWKLHCMGYILPQKLAIYGPFGFRPEVYEALLPFTEEACKLEGNEGAERHAYKLSLLFSTVREAQAYLRRYREEHPKAKQPVHDACLFEVPTKSYWSIAAWREILRREAYGDKWMRIFTLAPAIEEAMNGPLPPLSIALEQIGEVWDGKTAIPRPLSRFYKGWLQKLTGHRGGPKLWEASTQLLSADYGEFQLFKIRRRKATELMDLRTEAAWKDKESKEQHAEATRRAQLWAEKDFKERQPFSEFLAFVIKSRCLQTLTLPGLIRLAVRARYQEVPKAYLPFALDCVRYGIERKYFDEAVAIMEKGKADDFVPAVRIPGDKVGYPGYVLEKMSMKDPDIFILGHKTNCCQTINSHTRDCVLHGAKSAYGSFYRLIREGRRKIYVAQAWVGLTEDYELLLDSIEWNKGFDTKMIMELFVLAATDILDRHPEIPRVLFGGGGNTPKDRSFERQDRVGSYSRMIGYKEEGCDSKADRYILAEQGKLDPTRLALVRSLEREASAGMPASDFLVTGGVDSYISKGKIRRELSLHPGVRTRFFRDHPRVKRLLMEQRKNPLIEQGHYLSKSNREHFGEFFIPLSGIKVLVQHKLKAEGLDLKEALFFENDPDPLVKYLRELQLGDGERVLIAFVDAVHSYALYLEGCEGQLLGILVDSEADPDDDDEGFADLFSAIRKDLWLFQTEATLQCDFYSCGTVTIKALLHLAREGTAVVQQLSAGRKGPGIYGIPVEETPLALLKFAQSAPVTEPRAGSHLTLPAALFHKSVSSRKDLSLRSYLSANIVQIDGKSYNAALLRKKYSYLKQIDAILQQ